MDPHASARTTSNDDPSEGMGPDYRESFFSVNPPTKSREELYREALLDVKADRGTPYDATQKDLDALKSLRANTGPFVSQMQATKEIIDHNEPGRTPSVAEMDAIGRLCEVLKDHDCSPDIVIKAFRDLDTVFFRGRLQDKVKIRWSSPEDLYPFMIPGKLVNGHTNTNFWGEKFDGMIVEPRKPWRFRQTTIRLSARDVFLFPGWKNPWMLMWCIVLHEMCHAYEGVRVQSGPEPAHGKHFGSRIRAVHARARELFGLCAIQPNEKYEGFE